LIFLKIYKNKKAVADQISATALFYEIHENIKI